ncbi:MAG: hypothetical protein U1F36_00475 [Planctomycetota bacterium]
MKNFVLGLALAAGLSLPIAAQQMGSINANAPKLTTAIEFADGAKISVTYRALNFGQGAFVEKMKQERFRTMLNENAKQNPCGSVTVSKDMTFSSGFKVPAGQYGLHFMISDRGTWVAALSTTGKEGDLELKQFPLRLKDMEAVSQRLSIQLEAGEEGDSCMLTLRFGKQGVSVKGSADGGDEKEGKEGKDGKGEDPAAAPAAVKR